MNLSRYCKKLAAAAIAAAIIAVIFFNFDNLFTCLNSSMLSKDAGQKADGTGIPSKINYIDDDRKAYVNYCKDYYSDEFPIGIDESVYEYFGTVNGYRLYRLQPLYISFDCVMQQEKIGGYVFESSCRYSPERTGLYIIGDDGVYTLKSAYEKKLINISKAYQLYLSKQAFY